MEDLFTRYKTLAPCRETILKARDALVRCFREGGKLLLCGNGGSAADCEHIVGELMKGFLKKRPLDDKTKQQMKEKSPSLDEGILSKLQVGLPAISLCSMTALTSAFSNDVDPELIYAQGVCSLGRARDVLFAISTSGNAKNVLAAAKVARGRDITVIALTGKSGGALGGVADIAITVPECETYKVQELHLPIYHFLCAQTESAFFEEQSRNETD